ncbi:Crp/Fnr family transcriptional regulator [Actinoallomurus iriomotensis]|uniref:Crp/Fnr family transcriptional regulator n=1 Tax=Actinoallomurus iriomotensis TaxID=478107 RepID=A0A9W6RRM9_9ACTN|nr:Crp/Fnr family transcriptional regulator [Actinoallomurus iriomotensis]GLY80523.1 hypothetical protein Airi01_087900 [Actinoallomurus iriomotensis]
MNNSMRPFALIAPRPGTLLARLPEAQREELLFQGRTGWVPAGQCLFRAGDPLTHVLVILRGVVKLKMVTADGDEVLAGVRVVGDVLGDAEALSGTTAHHTFAFAGTAGVEVRTIGREVFNRQMQLMPAEATGYLAEQVHNNLWHHLMTRRSTRARLALLLYDLAVRHGQPAPAGGRVIDLGLTRTELGSAIGASRVSVDRVLTAMTAMGLITTGYREITIIDLSGLAQAAALEP